MKIYGRLVRKDLIKYMDVHEFWDNKHHRSCKGCSTVSHLLLHHDYKLRAMGNGENSDVIYVDFAKAYEKVDH